MPETYPDEVMCECFDCGSEKLDFRPTDWVDSQTTSEEIHCMECGAVFQQVFEVTETTWTQEGRPECGHCGGRDTGWRMDGDIECHDCDAVTVVSETEEGDA